MKDIDTILADLLSQSKQGMPAANSTGYRYAVAPDDARINDLAEGYEPAKAVLLQTMELYPLIDKDSAVDPVWSVTRMCSYNGVTGWRVNALLEICHDDLLSFIAVLRLVQLGFERATFISDLLDGKATFDKQAVIQRIRQRLKNFGSEPIGTAFSQPTKPRPSA